MCGTLKSSYQGWEITVRCLKFHAAANRRGQGESFTASGRAVLHDATYNAHWTDARPQVITLGGRIFDSTATCAQVLQAEMTILLDALKRIPPQPLPC
jgi:hypothetical protein